MNRNRSFDTLRPGRRAGARPGARFGRAVLGLLLAAVLSVPQAAHGAKLGPGLAETLASAAPDQPVEVVVTFHGDAVTAGLLGAVGDLGITSGLYLESLPILGALALPAQVEALAAMPEVRSIWPNLEVVPENFESTSVTGVQRLRADPILTARNGGFPYSGRGVTVLVNDSGVDGTHQDLEFGPHLIENVEAATNLHALSDLLPITYVEGVPNTDIGSGHGSHVAGIVGGTGELSGGKYEGAAPGAGLVGYGSGAVIFILDVLGAFDYAITHQFQHRIRVITNSWGTPSDTGTPFDPDDPINVATKKATDRNMVVVFSAGNSGPGEDSISGNYKKAPWVITVANGDKLGGLNASSSRGLAGRGGTVEIGGQTFTWEDRPSVTAPGTFVISARATTNTVTLIAGQAGPAEDAARIEPAFLPFYTVLSGTSMSAPHVAGIVALMLEANPRLTPFEVREILEQTATNVPGREGWEVGAGYVNALAAVDRAAELRDYGATVNLFRAFNARQELSVEQQPVEVEYHPLPELSPTANQMPFTVPEGLAELVARVDARGVLGETGNTINLVLIAPDGTEFSSGIFVLFPLFVDRTVSVQSPMPGDWILELRGLRGAAENPTDGAALPETVRGFLRFKRDAGFSGLDDIAGHPAEGAIRAAVAERLVDGFADGTYRPDDALSRIRLADYLAMGAAARQFLPLDGGASLVDVASEDLSFAEAAAARGAALQDTFHAFRGVVLPTAAGEFSPDADVVRWQLAYSLVQSLGLEDAALALEGQEVTAQFQDERVPVVDAGDIPAGFAGYVQLALDLNILNAFFFLEQGPFDLEPVIKARFEPLRTVARGEYAVAATRFFNAYLEGTEE